MMMLRRRMLRRKTDPKTRKHTLCEPEQSKCRQTLCKSHFVWKITVSKHRFARACAGEITRAILHGNLQEKWPRTPPGTSFCLSLRSGNAHGQSTSAILHRNLQEKRPGTPPTSFCARLRSRNAQGHVTRGILCEIYRENAGRFRLQPRLNTGP